MGDFIHKFILFGYVLELFLSCLSETVVIKCGHCSVCVNEVGMTIVFNGHLLL